MDERRNLARQPSFPQAGIQAARSAAPPGALPAKAGIYWA